MVAGVMIGICFYGLVMTLLQPEDVGDPADSDAGEEGTILLCESTSDNAPPPINHAGHDRAVVDEKPALPAYTDDESAQPVLLEGEGEQRDDRQVVGSHDGLFTLLHGYGHF